MLQRLIVAAAATLLTGAALAADASRPIVYPSAPPPAPGPTLTGDLSLSVGGLFDHGYYEYGLFNTLARVNKPLNDKLQLEVEAGGQALFYGGESERVYVDGVAHLWGMHSPSAAWGVFGGATFGYGSIGWVGGAEAKHFLAKGSLGVSAAATYCGLCGTTVGAFTASYNHYFNPNHRIGIRAGVLTDFSYALWEVAADVEHRFTHPISLFAEATYFGGDGRANFWTAKGGVRFFLDDQGDTLQSHETKVPWSVWQPTYAGIAQTVSDARLKHDIELIDHLPNGLGLYRYRYLWSDTVYVGVMAQEVAQVFPEAVVQGADGYLRVNYTALGLHMLTWDQWMASGQRFSAISG